MIVDLMNEHELIAVDAQGAVCGDCGRVGDWLEHLAVVALDAMNAPAPRTRSDQARLEKRNADARRRRAERRAAREAVALGRGDDHTTEQESDVAA